MSRPFSSKFAAVALAFSLGCTIVAPMVAVGSERVARADSSALVLGEVSTMVGHDDVVPLLRTSLALAVAKVTPPAGKKFIVSATLTQLETTTERGQATTTCVVSLAVRDGGGVLLGMTIGNSSVTTRPSDASAQRSVLEAAVRGATKPLPEVLAKG